MSEKQEIVHVVLRDPVGVIAGARSRKAVKVFDDRADAREYRDRMNKRSRSFFYTVQSCKKG